MANTYYDFIIVGAGPAGCALAWKLSRSQARPSVLLIEAGGKNDNPLYRIDAEKWITRFNLELNWWYRSIAQPNLNDRMIDMDRGKGLGGSSAINFSVWNVGPRDDFEEIAKRTGDDEWKWENAQRLLKEIEGYDGTAPKGLEKFLKPISEDHGMHGPIKVGFPKVGEAETAQIMDLWFSAGHEFNPDLGSGNPLGLGLAATSGYNATRSTAADMLRECPSNLHIKMNATVHKILIEEARAVGVQLLDGEKVMASKEIILCAGSLDSPKILMHSGIGPEDQLRKFGIPVVHANSNIGANLKDHLNCAPAWIRKDHTSTRPAYFKNPHLRDAAVKQWQESKSGPLAEFQCCFGVGFFKNDPVLKSPEFQQLPESEKGFIQAPTVPAFEIAIGGVSVEYFVDPLNHPTLTTIWIFCMNSQSTGRVFLQSADPNIPLLCDPNFLSHPYDKRVAVESMREVLRVVETAEFKKDTIGLLHGPKSDSEEDILAYWQERGSTSWHMTGTVKMGRGQQQDSACVDRDFKLIGISKLRVADQSVYPILPNCHTQTTAYLAGALAGEKIIRSYQLDKATN
jgi:choline dehydrogenase-like flavoprotein